MQTSPDLHVYDLSGPSLAWLNRLLGFKDLRESVSSSEGPPIFAKLSSLAEFRKSVGLAPETPIALLKSPNSELPKFFSEIPATEFSTHLDEWAANFTALVPPHTNSVLVVYLQNPQLYDGFAVQPEILMKLLVDMEVLRSRWSRVVIISDETLGSFCWDNHDDPAQIARLAPSILEKWEIYVGFRTEVLLGPEGDASKLHLWPVPKSQALIRPDTILVASPVAWKLLQRDLTRGIEIVRFRHLAMRNLKVLGYILSPLVQSKKIKVEHWPLSGLYLTFSIPDRGSEDPLLLQKRIERHGLKLFPRPQAPGQLSFCFILDNAPLHKGLDTLSEAIELL